MLALALLHPIANLSWGRWSIHPSTVIGIAALGALYIWASYRMRRSPTDAQKIFFVSGLLVMFATLNGPIHDLSDDYLFSAHMVQHLLLTLAIPPLLLAGTPGWMLRPILSVRGIRPVAQFFTRAQIAFVFRRGSEGPPLLIDAARRLEPLDPALARETYLEALGAAMYAGPLNGDSGVLDVAEAVRAAPVAAKPPRSIDVVLDGMARRCTDGPNAGTAP